MTLFSLIFLLVTQMVTLTVFGSPTHGEDLDVRLSNTLEHQNLSNTVSNFSAILPPTGFTYDVTRGSRDADSRGCFWLTLNAISELAKHPFDGSFPRLWMTKYPNNHRLTLVLSGYTEAEFRVKEMIWGLMLAIKHMNSHDQFRISVGTTLLDPSCICRHCATVQLEIAA